MGDYGGDKGFPGNDTGVDEVVEFGGRGGGGEVGEQEVEKDLGEDVDGNPVYCVLAGEILGDLAEVFGTSYDLQSRLDQYIPSICFTRSPQSAQVGTYGWQPLLLVPHSPLFQDGTPNLSDATDCRANAGDLSCFFE